MKDSLSFRWKQFKRSDVALREDSVEALRQMPIEELVHLAHEALETVEKYDDDGYEYLQVYTEEHTEGVGDMYCFWCIAQSMPDGSFNKWTKVVGGLVYNSNMGMKGQALLYHTWTDAKAAHEEMYKSDPEIGRYMLIYPVVVVAGREPRTTKPRRE